MEDEEMPRKSDVTIIRDHLKEKHRELYGIDYVTNSHAFEGRQLKAMIAEYGADVVRRFVDACFIEYKPTRDYPGSNFAFMYSYMRARVLPRVQAEMKREEEREARGPARELSAEEFENLL
jgi:hypothetical protein